MTTLLGRRALLRQCLGALAFGRHMAWGRATLGEGYRDLRSPIVLPLKEIADPWRALRFDARVPRRDPTGGDVLLEGILLRTPDPPNSPDHANAADPPNSPDPADGPGVVKAFCLLCPHEICNVEYVTNAAQVRLESGATPEHPLLVCPCHFSVFDPLSDGARISGPAYRGLYRFTVAIKHDTVEIAQVEEEVLTLLE